MIKRFDMNFDKIQYLNYLPLIAAPLIIYLIFKKKPDRIIFGSLYLLRNISEKIRRKARIKDIILLIVRTLIIFFVIMLFSEPFSGGRSSFDPLKRNTTVIYLDSSPSMADALGNGNKFNIAVNLVLEAVSGAGENDIFYIFTSDPAKKFKGGKKEALQFISGCEVYGNDRKFSEFISAADSILNFAVHTNRMILAVSDGYNDMSGEVSITGGHFSKAVLVRGSDVQNEVSLDSFSVQDRNRIRFGVAADKGDTKLEVFAQGRKIYSEKIGFEKETRRDLIVEIPQNISGDMALTAMVTDKGNPLNNNFNLVIPELKKKSILIVGDAGSYVVKNITSLLKAAGDLQLIPETADLKKLPSLRLKDYDAVLLTDITALSNYLSSLLKNYVSEGGSVFLTAGENFSITDYNSNIMPAFGAPRLTGVEDFKGSFFPIKIEDISHPVFVNVFDASFKGISSVEIYRIYKFVPQGWSVLIRSGGHPFLLEKTVGKGKVFLMASGFEKSSSNIIGNGFAVPLLLNTLDYMSGSDRLEPNFFFVGDILKLDRKFSKVDQSRQYEIGKHELSYSFQLDRAGFYNLYDSRGEYIKKIAVNNVRETFDDNSDIFRRVFTSCEYHDEISDMKKLVSFEKKSFTKYMLALILLLTAAEIIIVRKM